MSRQRKLGLSWSYYSWQSIYAVEALLFPKWKEVNCKVRPEDVDLAPIHELFSLGDKRIKNHIVVNIVFIRIEVEETQVCADVDDKWIGIYNNREGDNVEAGVAISLRKEYFEYSMNEPNINASAPEK